MRSCVFAVVGALLAGGVVVPSVASADEATTSGFSAGILAEEEYYLDGMAKFVFGEPGKLTVDASHGLAGFPVPADTLVFSSQEAYVEFMVRAFNAQFVYDPETGSSDIDLEVVTYGIPYASNEQGDELVPVTNPVNTFLGGPHGYFVVGNKVVCTNQARCPMACLPELLNSEAAFDAATASQVSLSNLEAQTLSLMDVGSMSQISMQSTAISAQSLVASNTIAPFGVFGFTNRAPIFNSSEYTFEIYSAMYQTSGILPYKTMWCGAPVYVEDPVVGLRVRFPQACSTVIVSPNRLSIDLDVYSTDYYECKWETVAFPGASKDNVSGISYGKSYTQKGNVKTNSGVFSHFIGVDSSGTAHEVNDCFGAGCFKRNPCE